MPRHTFIRQSKIRDVKGRIDYIQNPKRQEHLYGAYDTTKPEYWKLLAAQNQMDFQRSGTSGKCIEARELIIALPEGLQLYEPEKLLKMMTDAFKEKYGVECAAALHHNKRKTNYHIHLIYSERQILEKVEEKIAARNMFYDENGRHVRTKKEIMDAAGNIRPGCIIIPKGTAYEINAFAPKNTLFKQENFVDEVRGFYTGIINRLAPEEEKLSVFPKGGPFLATQKIGKNNPKEKEIMESNELRQKWNTAVSDGLMRGMSAEDLKQAKKKWITEPVARSLKKYDRNPGIFIMIMKKAISLLVEKVRDFRPSIMATIAQLKEETQKREITKHSMKSRKRKRDIER